MIKKIGNAFLFCTLITMGFQTPAVTPKNQNSQKNWYDHFVFNDPNFTFEFIRTLGYAYEKGADLGESVATAKKITDGDFDSWYRAWLATAERIARVATTADQQQHTVTAREAHFRASNYYRTAGFYMDAPQNRAKSIAAYQQSKDHFLKAISSLPYI